MKNLILFVTFEKYKSEGVCVESGTTHLQILGLTMIKL